MKVTILIFCLHDRYYVNIKQENLGMIEIVPHWKIGPQLLCGRMNTVMKNLFFNLKLDVSSAQGQFLKWCLDSPPKKYKGANFHKNWPYRTQVMTISLDTENSRWWISEKKALKLPKFQKPISQEPFRVGGKNFAHFCFL